ncbi:extracellular solute-binding protein [Pelagibacterium luteolum]|uniref:Carbohydrate ABC transporter substrate-binding protein, CUT1 family n=1 Tax=Pelagibacterium luteolum TaxID=440168 RepID=A0A1G7YEV9_9HYPH|nr:extracellular solute-binding protein [Pelagibacterium luteolum]SDG94809.1 carbohydrate ABC transporter substrate-binding protein, CUT1 family [Pelagibacterium luteolum]
MDKMLKLDRARSDLMRSVARGSLVAITSAGVTLSSIAPALAQDNSIEFWTQSYGDALQWNATIRDLAAEFEAETGISVQHETINWSVAFDTWLTVSRGGAAPDCADMYWLHSFSAIGGDQYGPMPINEYRDQWENLDENFFEGSLQDVTWQGDFYGIPWRGDIRSFIYRTDAFAEAGIEGPPETWDEIVDIATELTERDENGNVTRWGYAYGTATNSVSWLLPYYWQAGGDFMTEDGRTATIDNEAMRTALTFMRDLMWEHEVVDPDSMEANYDPQPGFLAGDIAMINSAEQSWGVELDRDYPQLEGQWAMSLTPEGPENRDSFSGGGYLGVLRGTDKVEQCVEWMEFLSQEDNMATLSRVSGNVSTRRDVMDSEFWNDRPWKVVVGEALEYARTSQHPAPAWSAIAAPEPGAVLYDMMYDAVVRQQDLDEVISRAQERMQAELDRSNVQ